MNTNWPFVLALATALTAVPACTHVKPESSQTNRAISESSGPAADLGDRTWGIACLSVACARERPEHQAELGTQVLMGNVVRVLEGARIWYRVETADGYHAWLEKGTFVRCTRVQADAWQNSPLLIVTALEERILEQPDPAASPVSDVVLGNLVKRIGEEGGWVHIELPDGRSGFLPKSVVTDYAAWKNSCQPTPENIERTAKAFIGRPYLWGANSPKGLDCSGLAKISFYMNGIDLKRNARDQAKQGLPVKLDPDLTQLKKGDLLYFGARARGERPERVSHVAIYLGDRLFIQSSERVQINSLDPNSPIRDEHRIRSLIGARRLLPDTAAK